MAMLLKTLAIAFAVVTSIAAAAPQQKTPVEGKLAFDAATIKQAAPNAVCCRVMPTSPNRMSIPSMTLSWLIYTAYGDGGFNT